MSHGLACRDAVTALTLIEWQLRGVGGWGLKVIPKSFVLQESLSVSATHSEFLIILK